MTPTCSPRSTYGHFLLPIFLIWWNSQPYGLPQQHSCQKNECRFLLAHCVYLCPIPLLKKRFLIFWHFRSEHFLVSLEIETSLSYIRMLNLKSIVTKNYFWLIDCWINPSHFLIHNIMPNEMQKSFYHATLDLAQKSINLHFFFLRNSRKTINANLTHNKKVLQTNFIHCYELNFDWLQHY